MCFQGVIFVKIYEKISCKSKYFCIFRTIPLSDEQVFLAMNLIYADEMTSIEFIRFTGVTFRINEVKLNTIFRDEHKTYLPKLSPFQCTILTKFLP